MKEKKQIQSIQKYLKTTRKKLNEALDKDMEYTTKNGNGVNCCEANVMFKEVEKEIAAILRE